jgi:hypothetical protein
MERSVPMDRLICGDVGYGKTEIAVRAAFKAVQDGKQVAVLVPDDPARAAAPADLRRAVRPVPGDGQGAVRFQTDKEAKAVSSPGWPTAASTSSSAPTGCSPTRGPVQGPRPRRRRRGAALRGRAQGAAQGAAHRRRRAGDVGDADPAHARDGRDRHPGDVDARHAARGAPPGPHLRRRLRREADHRGDPPRAAARGPGLLRPQQGVRRSRRPPRGCASSSPRRGSPSPTARWARAARAGRRRLLGEALRRARLHDDRRDRPGHLQRQHPHRRARRPARPLPAAPAARPGRPGPRARLRLLPLPAREAAHRDRARPARRRSPATPTSAPACRWR